MILKYHMYAEKEKGADGNYQYRGELIEFPSVMYEKNLHTLYQKAKEFIKEKLQEDFPPKPIPANEVGKSNGIIVEIEVDYEEGRLVKKTLTIPYVLNRLAEERSINFSQLLRKAIKEELGIEG